MTDTELIAAVAQKVMGWRCLHDRGERARFDCILDYDAIIYHDASGGVQAIRTWDGQQSNSWQPLTDWNDTFQVVEKMRERGLYFSLNETLSQHRIWTACFSNGTGEFTDCRSENLQRAILEAALEAMEGSVTDE